MIPNDVFKETLKNKLTKSSGKPYNENYNAGQQRYGSITITQKSQHWLVWELVDRGGKLVDSFKKGYNSFDELWIDLKELLLK